MENLFRAFTTEALALVPKIAASALLFAGFWLASAFVLHISRRIYERSDLSNKDVVNLLGQIAKITLLVIGLVTALGTIGINVTALVAGLGLTGFALGFALRDALSNLLAGILILIYRPFHRHDYISVTGLEGLVTEIDLRYTTLESEGKRYLIPNSILFTNPITLDQTKHWPSSVQ